MSKSGYVYILASRRNGTLYIGVTSDPVKRVWQHKQDQIDGFTKRYGVHRLVHIEQHPTMYAAIEREKRLKKWRRTWKLRLIEAGNPDWRDLYDEICSASGTHPTGSTEILPSREDEERLEPSIQDSSSLSE